MLDGCSPPRLDVYRDRRYHQCQCPQVLRELGSDRCEVLLLAEDFQTMARAVRGNVLIRALNLSLAVVLGFLEAGWNSLLLQLCTMEAVAVHQNRLADQ